MVHGLGEESGERKVLTGVLNLDSVLGVSASLFTRRGACHNTAPPRCRRLNVTQPMSKCCIHYDCNGSMGASLIRDAWTMSYVSISLKCHKDATPLRLS